MKTLFALVLMLVSILVALTVAPGTADPVGSVTVPVMLAKVVWAYPFPARSDKSTPKEHANTTLVDDMVQ